MTYDDVMGRVRLLDMVRRRGTYTLNGGPIDLVFPMRQALDREFAAGTLEEIGVGGIALTLRGRQYLEAAEAIGYEVAP